MKRITVQLKSSKALQILKDLEENNFIKLLDLSLNGELRKQELFSLKPKRKTKNESFFSLAGIWEERNISTDQLRAEAWPKRK